MRGLDYFDQREAGVVMSKTFLADTAERAVFTFVEAFSGLLLAGTFTLNIGAVKAAAVSGLIAALAVVKAALATQVGDGSSASLLNGVSPSGLLAATGVEDDTRQ